MYTYYHLRLARRSVFQVDFVEAPLSFSGNLLSAQVVTADGQLVKSLEDQLHASHELLRLLSEQKPCVLLDSRFRFEDVRAAHAEPEANKTYGKVILTS